MSSRRELANAIRALSMDAVQKAKSGHPGAPMGMADIAEVLWNNHLKYNPANSNWADRDRFVLSNGHGSMLIYSLLHLTGFDLSIDEIKNLLRYCDLNWSNDCLNFYNNKRPIKTASDVQARSRIYTSSIDSWKNYEKYLSKYFIKLKN